MGVSSSGNHSAKEAGGVEVGRIVVQEWDTDSSRGTYSGPTDRMPRNVAPVNACSGP